MKLCGIGWRLDCVAGIGGKKPETFDDHGSPSLVRTRMEMITRREMERECIIHGLAVVIPLLEETEEPPSLPVWYFRLAPSPRRTGIPVLACNRSFCQSEMVRYESCRV